MKYIVAVSGGVDSIVLLDMLVHNVITIPDAEFVVAHFDHGIRAESADDAVFVGDRAKYYGLPYETARVELGEHASEETARTERYKFLQSCRKKYNASAIITAHHQDDMIETVVFNLGRGTGWRGLASLDSGGDILRPLLSKTKHDLLDHAHKHKLNWVEDVTNNDTNYARNSIRHTLIPQIHARDHQAKSKLHTIISATKTLKTDINHEVAALVAPTKLTTDSFVVSRYKLIMWPRSVSLEVVRHIVLMLDPHWHPSTRQLERILLFCKAARPGAVFELAKAVKLHSQKHHIQFKKY